MKIFLNSLFSTLNHLNSEGAADKLQSMSFTMINSLDETSDILVDIEFDEDCKLEER
ncbi:26705_t:CDS:2, partial [Racocetra persica]